VEGVAHGDERLAFRRDISTQSAVADPRGQFERPWKGAEMLGRERLPADDSRATEEHCPGVRVCESVLVVGSGNADFGGAADVIHREVNVSLAANLPETAIRRKVLGQDEHGRVREGATGRSSSSR